MLYSKLSVSFLLRRNIMVYYFKKYGKYSLFLTERVYLLIPSTLFSRSFGHRCCQVLKTSKGFRCKIFTATTSRFAALLEGRSPCRPLVAAVTPQSTKIQTSAQGIFYKYLKIIQISDFPAYSSICLTASACLGSSRCQPDVPVDCVQF